MSLPSYPIFVATAPGLEPVCAGEIAAMELGDVREVPGGVELSGGLEAIYRLNLGLGPALKVLVRLAQAKVTKLPRLRKLADEIPWANWLSPGCSVRVRASCARSRLYHSGAVEERVQHAIANAVRIAEKPEQPVEEVMVRMQHDVCTISINTTGGLLSKRGYRLETGKAPLREDLAHALVLISNWNRKTDFLDPFCGSGTIAIEADRLARCVPPGWQREFSFARAPGFDPALWQRVRDRASTAMQINGPNVFGSDRDAGVVMSAERNAQKAESNAIFTCAAMSASSSLLAAAPLQIVSNPPYGRRIGGQDQRPLFQQLGNVVRRRTAATRLALVVPDRRMAAWVDPALESKLVTDHGGGKVFFVVAPR